MDRNKILWALLIGAVVGEVLMLWLAPKYIVWYFDPPVEMGFSCREPIDWALSRLQVAQIVGIVGGGLVGIVTLFFVRRRLAPKFPTGG